MLQIWTTVIFSIPYLQRAAKTLGSFILGYLLSKISQMYDPHPNPNRIRLYHIFWNNLQAHFHPWFLKNQAIVSMFFSIIFIQLYKIKVLSSNSFLRSYIFYFPVPKSSSYSLFSSDASSASTSKNFFTFLDYSC